MAVRISCLAQPSAELMSLSTGVNTQAQVSTVSFSRIMKAHSVSFGEYLAVTKALRWLNSRSGESDARRKANGIAAEISSLALFREQNNSAQIDSSGKVKSRALLA